MRTPCQDDPRDWTEITPPTTRADVTEMLALCAGCPLLEECFQAGRDGERDARGEWVGGSYGIWGGVLWRNGRSVPPRSRVSIYEGVHWRPTEGKWRAFGQSDGRRTNLGTYASEEDAAAAVAQWRRDEGRRLRRRLQIKNEMERADLVAAERARARSLARRRAGAH